MATSLTAALLGLALASYAGAASAQIREPGNHLAYSLEIEPHLLVHEGPHLLPPRRRADGGGDLPPPRRPLTQGGNVEVAVESERERPRDRGRGQEQHVGPRPLPDQRRALLGIAALLLHQLLQQSIRKWRRTK